MSRRGPRDKAQVHPTARDQALFAYIGTYGLVALEQVHRRFWPHAQRQTCQDRLQQLVAGGYLHTSLTTARGTPEPIYWIERKASLLFTEEVRVGFIRGHPAPAEIAHLLRVVDAVEAIGRSYPVLAFTHEHSLKREESRASTRRGQRHQVADARVRLAVHGAPDEYLLEIDGAYYGQRLTKKVHALAARGERVLWIVYSPRRLATITRATAGIATIRPILFSSL